MTGDDLAAEMWSACLDVRKEHVGRLADLGCPVSAMRGVTPDYPPFGVRSVRWLAGGLYEPDDEGETVVIQPVLAREREWGDAGVIDLLAWRTSQPRRWAWRIGHAWALGTELLDRPEPVRVVETPLQWLAAGGEALCILDWAAPAQSWGRLRSGPPLILPDDTLRRKLGNAMTLAVPLPRMEVACAA